MTTKYRVLLTAAILMLMGVLAGCAATETMWSPPGYPTSYYAATTSGTRVYYYSDPVTYYDRSYYPYYGYSPYPYSSLDFRFDVRSGHGHRDGFRFRHRDGFRSHGSGRHHH